MHDPMVVAHEIRRPWPERSKFSATGSRGDGVRWRIRHHHDHFEDTERPGYCGGCDRPMTSTYEHFPWYKPGSYRAFWRLAGRDFYWPSLITVWHVEPRGRDALTECSRRYQDRDGGWHYTKGWRWHVWHWRIQVRPLQKLRRNLLTRCEWCGGRSRKDDVVNHSQQWDGEHSPWWRGERGLFHGDCSGYDSAHKTCTCAHPATNRTGYGKCSICLRFRPYGLKPEQAAHMEALRRDHPVGVR